MSCTIGWEIERRMVDGGKALEINLYGITIKLKCDEMLMTKHGPLAAAEVDYVRIEEPKARIIRSGPGKG